MTNDQPEILTLDGVPAPGTAPHLLGSLASDDLNVNLMRFADHEGIDEHVNREVDVLIVGLDGEGIVTVDSTDTTLGAGQATIIPKGTRRSIRSNGERFAYLTCHGQRRGMMPTIRAGS